MHISGLNRHDYTEKRPDLAQKHHKLTLKTEVSQALKSLSPACSEKAYFSRVGKKSALSKIGTTKLQFSNFYANVSQGPILSVCMGQKSNNSTRGHPTCRLSILLRCPQQSPGLFGFCDNSPNNSHAHRHWRQCPGRKRTVCRLTVC